MSAAQNEFEALSAQLRALIQRLTVVADGMSRWYTGAADETVNNGLQDIVSLAGLLVQVQAQVDARLDPSLTGDSLTPAATNDDVPGTTSATIDAVAQALLNRLTYQVAALLAMRGAANGVADLDASGVLPLARIPSSLIGGVKYIGTWDASSGTAPSGAPGQGNAWRVSVAGTTALSGITDWAVGDWAIWNGAAWDKLDNTDQVTSVFGRKGAIVPSDSDYDATKIVFLPGSTGLSATRVQAALEEMVRGDVITQCLAADSATLTGTPDTPVTPFSVPVAAGEKWVVDFAWECFGLAGLYLSAQVPSGATLVLSAFGCRTSPTNTQSAGTSTSGSTIGPFCTGVAGDHLMLMGRITVINGSNAGNIQIRHQGSSANKSTVVAGSSISARRAKTV